MSRDALVVGINHYQDEKLPDLTTPAEDAEAIAQCLGDFGEFETISRLPQVKNNTTNQIRVGKTTEVTLTQLEDALIKLFKPEGKQIPDTALFYFSGHGIRKNKGIQEGFLATSDVFPDVSFNGLSLQWLRQLLQESPVKQQIIWLDCCHSGELLNVKEADPGEQGTARDRCFIASSRGFEQSYQSLALPYSVMTSALLKGLQPHNCPQRWLNNYDLITYLLQYFQSEIQKPIFSNFGEPIKLTRIIGQQPEALAREITTDFCPYKGLAYFDNNETDPHYFYGREKLTDQLVDRVRQQNFLAVLGASGSGKSSVLRAGLLSQLQLGHKLAGSDQWQILIFVPGENPLESLALSWLDESLSGVARASQLDQIETLIEKGSEGLHKLVSTSTKERIILVIDQFEEVFTLCQDEQKRQSFFELLLGTLAKTPKLTIIIAMRIDFFGKCLEREYSGLGKQIQEHLIAVSPMNKEELEQAITQPALKVNLEIEPALVTEMLRDVEGSAGSLPLLQYTLTELWKHRSQSSLHQKIELETYVQLGGIGGTLNQRATAVYQKLTPVEQKIAQHIFLNLTQLGENTEDTRRRVRQRDLITTKHPQELLSKVIKILADEKLIITSELIAKSGEGSREAVIDVPHEALIRHWQLLREWLDQSRSFLLQQREIENLALKWEAEGKTVDYLLRGKSLKKALDFQNLQGEYYSLSQEAIAFLNVSLKSETKFKNWLVLTSLASFFAVFTSLFYWVDIYSPSLSNQKNKIQACIGKPVCEGRDKALNSLLKNNNKSLKGYNFTSNTDLSEVKFAEADLGYANFNKANLSFANFNKANLSFVNFNKANLTEADLTEANLTEANLTEANLTEADLYQANLYQANLYQANLTEANLYHADLIDANLTEANLYHAYIPSLESSTLSPFVIKSACNWEKAIYKAHYDEAKKKWVVDQKANEDYIRELADNKASNPKNPIDCSMWEEK